jgi:hypothetical protein
MATIAEKWIVCPLMENKMMDDGGDYENFCHQGTKTPRFF